MIVDTSALIAMLRREPDAAILRERLLAAQYVSMSAGTLLECRMIAARYDVAGELAELIEATAIRIIPVDEAQVTAAFDGFRRYGKGRHPTGLNLGDLFAYGLARLLDEPLLFKGDDFARTDIRPALS